MNLHQSLAEWSRWGWPLLANHLWQATLFAALVWLAAFWLKRGPARARHALWLIASIKFLLPSALLLFFAQRCGLDFSRFMPAATSSERSADFVFQVVEQVTRPIPQSVISVTVTAAPASGHSELYCALTIIWLLGAAAVFGVWVKRRWQFAQAVGAGRRVEQGREVAVLRRVHAWLAVKREVGLIISPRIGEPGVWRLWRSVIVLPEGMAERLSDDEFEAVMMHELIHVRRWDNLLSTLQMLLCCALWFHPLVWLIDRWLLGERELVCDEQVIECGGAPQLYADSLWKVVQFGLGWPVAGVSRAASSNLRRRIEQMMITDRQTKLSLAHRALIGAAALALVALSIITGLLTRDGVNAQSQQQRIEVTGGVPGGVPGGVSGGVAGGVSGGVPGGVPGGVQGGAEMRVSGTIRIDSYDPQMTVTVDGQSRSIREKLEQAPPLAIRFENADDTPLVITDARIKYVKDEESLAGLRSAMGTTEAYALKLNVALTNNTSRKITGLGVELRNTSEKGRFTIYFERVGLNINPGALFAFDDNSGARITTLNSTMDFPENCIAKVVGVRFEEAPHWGTLKLSTNRTSVTGSLLIQNEATNDGKNSSEYRRSVTNVSEWSTSNLDETAISDLVNMNDVTAKPRITFKERASYTSEARANGIEGTVLLSAVFGSDGKISNIRVVRGLSGGLSEQAIEAAKRIQFEPAIKDGQSVSTRANIEYNFAISTSQFGVLKQSGGVLQGNAIRKPAPPYPGIARTAKVSGAVQVRVLISEAGEVIEAEAVSGHQLLRDAAVETAKQWVFRPTELSGVPVKVEGILTFNFTLQ